MVLTLRPWRVLAMVLTLAVASLLLAVAVTAASVAAAPPALAQEDDDGDDDGDDDDGGAAARPSAPVGGVQTGAGGTAEGDGGALPLAAAGTAALGGLVVFGARARARHRATR